MGSKMCNFFVFFYKFIELVLHRVDICTTLSTRNLNDFINLFSFLCTLWFHKSMRTKTKATNKIENVCFHTVW